MSIHNKEIALSVENLTKRFGDFVAVNGINLDIGSGQIFGILGPNGAGKSTIIMMITGLLRPDAGIIKIFGKKSFSNSSVDTVGLCPQELVVWEGLTLIEQLVFIAQMHNVTSHIAKERALELLDVMCLSDKKDKLASTLSGGMKRRLNILLAMMHDPKILILDEPQVGLDPQSRILVRDYIKSIARKKTVIITTHDMEEADKITDWVAIIDGGKILVEDTPDNLKKAAFKGDILEFTVPDINAVSENIENALKQKYNSISYHGNTIRIVCEKPFEILKTIEEIFYSYGIKTEDIKIRKGTLEDVFISLTGRGLRE